MIFNDEHLQLTKRFFKLELKHLGITFIRGIPSFIIWGVVIQWFLFK